MTTLEQKMARIADLLGDPCPVPDIDEGYDLCPCDSGHVWPCRMTMAIWLARGLDPDVEATRILHNLRNRLKATDQ